MKCIFLFFFFNDTATTEIYTLSLHDALPIYKTQDLEKNKPSKTESPHLDTSKPEIPTPVSPNDVQLEKQKSKKIYETGSKKANKGKSKAAKAKAWHSVEERSCDGISPGDREGFPSNIDDTIP